VNFIDKPVAYSLSIKDAQEEADYSSGQMNYSLSVDRERNILYYTL